MEHAHAVLVIDFMQECMQHFLSSFLETVFMEHLAALVATAYAFCHMSDICANLSARILF